ncbi:MAG: OmpA family protein [Ignavibacteriales bacterium]
MKKVGVLLVGFAVLAVALYIISCAKPNEELTNAEAALQSAKEAGAPELAPAEYQAAEDLIKRAKDLIAQGKNKEARELLEEARFKAIEAKGKAIIAKSQGAMTPQEQQAREQKLEELKQGGGLSKGPNIGLQDVFFDFDKSNVRADARGALREDAEIMKNNPGVLVVIEGYCDTRGTEEYNLALGQRRADSVKAYIVGLGVSPSKLEAVSKGETEQWAPGSTEEAYQQNRRAHFTPTSPSPQAVR